ncbi:triphosphoribosyl-dephospho-CoA synthase MdcB [Insolitispirillum peregrinum]|uniref:triphosphoribosyl-dephospho-CoA synthase MdcB n=1 Tax=Insolitispirillum peregrinum TaxID=80876 RepID=UPI003614900D
MSHLLPLRRAPTAQGRTIARAAVRALHTEVALYPKPGLVSLIDSGAHHDMDATTFLRSLFSLRHYFAAIADLGAAGHPFASLQWLGMRAEQRMLTATGGINTHRGAIFCLGLLAAAAGWRLAHGQRPDRATLARTVVEVWGEAIAEAGSLSRTSNGSRAVRRYGARGAREEVLEGFPTLITVALPALDEVQTGLGCARRARVQALFAVMAELEDTNLLHRGGPDGLAFVQREARLFLERGGVHAPDWMERAVALHRACIQRHLSPGGAADVLAAACFVKDLEE